MKKNLLLLLSVVALSLSFAACSKDKEDDKQESQLIGTWRLDTSNIDESLFEDMEEFQECQLESTVKFNNDGTLTLIDGCTGDDLSDETGTIKWSSEDGKLKLTLGEELVGLPIGMTITLKIITINSKKLVVEIPDFTGQLGGTAIQITLIKV